VHVDAELRLPRDAVRVAVRGGGVRGRHAGAVGRAEVGAELVQK